MKTKHIMLIAGAGLGIFALYKLFSKPAPTTLQTGTTGKPAGPATPAASFEGPDDYLNMQSIGAKGFAQFSSHGPHEIMVTGKRRVVKTLPTGRVIYIYNKGTPEEYCKDATGTLVNCKTGSPA